VARVILDGVLVGQFPDEAEGAAFVREVVVAPPLAHDR
jgi:hypothetical protein